MKKKIAVIDDEAPIRESLKGVLEDEGFQILTAEDGESGIRLVRENIPDLVLLDIWMKGIDGLEVLKRLKEELPFIPVIIMSGHGTIDIAVSATKLGAFDFIEKPISLERLFLLIENAIRYYELLNENIFLKKKVGKSLDIASKSEKIKKIIEDLKYLSKSDKTILFLGEEGVGKSFFSRYFHHIKGGDEKDFHELNLTNPNSEDLEMLFSLKNAKNFKTLFIKEFQNLTQNLRYEILKMKSHINFIFSSSVDIQRLIESDKAFASFYYGMEIISFSIPPLRERKEDIEAFIDFYSSLFSKQYGKKIKLTKEALEILNNYNWNGNIKELKNFLEYEFITSKTDLITQKDLPDYIRLNSKISSLEEDIFKHNLLSEAKRLFEKEFIKMRLIEAGGNIKRASEIMGVKEKLLVCKMKYYGIDRWK
ncbi:MAG: sigma-54 dependent transcriptional regulator [Proteobacteria bacterium]|nr:sigma-54 dependent transcriptional regulator [Pseudomonadota bacterium]